MSAALSLPLPMDADVVSVRLVPALTAPSRCACAHCAQPRHVAAADPDGPDEPRRALGEGILGARRPQEPSRYVEIRALERLRFLGDVEDLSPGERAVLGLGRDAYKRTSRADFTPSETARTRRNLTATERAASVVVRELRDPHGKPVRLPVLEALQKWPVRPELRRRVERWEWIAETWRELVEPPKSVKPVNDLQTRLQRAIWRAEDRLSAMRREITLPETTLSERR